MNENKHDVKEKSIQCINLNHGNFKVKFIRDKRISCFGREQKKVNETIKENTKNLKENEEDCCYTSWKNYFFFKNTMNG